MGDQKMMVETEKEKVKGKETATVKEMVTEKEKSLEFIKRRDNLYREVQKLIFEEPSTKIAVLFTDPSSKSDVCIHSFGEPSANGVVQTFLEDNSPDPASPEEEEEEEVDEEEEDENYLSEERLKREIEFVEHTIFSQVSSKQADQTVGMFRVRSR